MKSIITIIKNTIAIILPIFIGFAFFTNAEYVTESIIKSLNFSIFSLFPSLFPYMIFSSIISHSTLINKVLSRIFKKVFSILGICIKYINVIFWGNISGFVVGPKLISNEKFKINEESSITKYILLSSNAGIGFLLSFVGQTIFGNLLFGAVLYITQIIVSFFLNSFVFFKKDNLNYQEIEFKKTPIFNTISNSISSSTNAFISICANTVVFATIARLIVKLLKISSNSLLLNFVYSLFDVSLGVKSAALIENKIISLFFVGFSVGFGGISIFFQIFSICDNIKINKFKFVISKLCQGIISGLISATCSLFFSFEPNKSAPVNLSIDKKIIKILIIYFFFFILVKFIIKIFINSKNINKLC